MIRIIVADDHQFFIDGIKSNLADAEGIKIIYEARNGKEVLEFLEKETADIVLMDIEMPELNGLDTTKIIKERYPSVKVLILTMHNNKEFVSGLLEHKVDGYILKNTSKRELKEAIQNIADQKSYFSQEVTGTILESLSEKNSNSHKEDMIQLTNREIEVLKMVAKGFKSNEIADKMFISPHTVDSHRKNLISKIGDKSVAVLTKYALDNGYID